MLIVIVLIGWQITFVKSTMYSSLKQLNADYMMTYVEILVFI